MCGTTNCHGCHFYLFDRCCHAIARGVSGCEWRKESRETTRLTKGGSRAAKKDVVHCAVVGR
jgi:hypothetical protein